MASAFARWGRSTVAARSRAKARTGARGHHTNRTPPYCAVIMPIACGVRGAERAAVAKCRRKIASRRMLAECLSTQCAGFFAPVLMSEFGQQRPNEPIDFESALTSTPDISLRRVR
jgi:hypothetical protein